MTREEAAKTLTELWGVDYRYCLGTIGIEAVDMAIEALEQPEQKKGKWLKPTGLSSPICSECHSCPNLLFGLTSKFCPNCGAKMDEV